GLPPRRPRRIGVRRHPLLLVPEQDPALAVALHAHVHGGKRGGAEFRRAQRLALPVADALEEVLPQGGGGVAAPVALEGADRLLRAAVALGLLRPAGAALRED